MAGMLIAVTTVDGLAAATFVVAAVAALGVVAFVSSNLRGSTPPAATEVHPWTCGSPAQATVTSVESDRGVRNLLNVQCAIEFLVEPLDGTGARTYAVECVLPFEVVPMVGDRWSARVSPADGGRVIAVAPSCRPVDGSGSFGPVDPGADGRTSAA